MATRFSIPQQGKREAPASTHARPLAPTPPVQHSSNRLGGW
ncbi:MAG TPA: hypothetical protein VFB60_08645 [Ktedonobacteraceae bacterium]|nr:hypothetical protein [Ktedonobacteraceae bacterium]